MPTVPLHNCCCSHFIRKTEGTHRWNCIKIICTFRFKWLIMYIIIQCRHFSVQVPPWKRNGKTIFYTNTLHGNCSLNVVIIITMSSSMPLFCHPKICCFICFVSSWSTLQIDLIVGGEIKIICDSKGKSSLYVHIHTANKCSTPIWIVKYIASKYISGFIVHRSCEPTWSVGH